MIFRCRGLCGANFLDVGNHNQRFCGINGTFLCLIEIALREQSESPTGTELDGIKGIGIEALLVEIFRTLDGFLQLEIGRRESHFPSICAKCQHANVVASRRSTGSTRQYCVGNVLWRRSR